MNIKLENLEINGYHIYQDKDSFNFGIDAVLLANFALHEFGVKSVNDVIKICDLCSGTLPIPLIMYAKRKEFLGEKIKISAFEIDKDQASLSNKSIIYNKENVEDAVDIEEDIKVYNDDVNNIINLKEKYKNLYETFDMVTVNPPYIKKGSGVVNTNDKKQVAKHEMSITFDEICKVANIVLKSNKKFYIVHHTERLTEIISTLKNNSFEVKKICYIHPYIDRVSTLVLIEAVKNAKVGLKVLPPIVIYNNDGSYTEKVLKYYGK